MQAGLAVRAPPNQQRTWLMRRSETPRVQGRRAPSQPCAWSMRRVGNSSVQACPSRRHAPAQPCAWSMRRVGDLKACRQVSRAVAPPNQECASWMQRSEVCGGWRSPCAVPTRVSMAAWRDVGHIRWAWRRRPHGRCLSERTDTCRRWRIAWPMACRRGMKRQGMADGLPKSDEASIALPMTCLAEG
jgi:hypothetical protein